MQPSAESLKKVVDGKVALMDGGHEQSLPGGEAEGKFCVSLSKLLQLDEVSIGVGSPGPLGDCGGGVYSIGEMHTISCMAVVV